MDNSGYWLGQFLISLIAGIISGIIVVQITRISFKEILSREDYKKLFSKDRIILGLLLITILVFFNLVLFGKIKFPNQVVLPGDIGTYNILKGESDIDSVNIWTYTTEGKIIDLKHCMGCSTVGVSFKPFNSEIKQ